jgi:hypothetical protein
VIGVVSIVPSHVYVESSVEEVKLGSPNILLVRGWLVDDGSILWPRSSNVIGLSDPDVTAGGDEEVVCVVELEDPWVGTSSWPDS